MTSKTTKIFIITIVLGGVCAAVSADVVRLTNGRVIQGIIVSEESGKVRLKVGPGMMIFDKNQLISAERSAPEENISLQQEWQAKEQKNEQRYQEALSRESLERARREDAKQYGQKAADITEQGQAIFVDGVINGTQRVKFLMDTGAAGVVLSETVARSLGYSREKAIGIGKAKLADGRSVDCYVVRLDKLEVGESWVNGLDAAVMPAKEASELGYEALLGMSFLKNFSFQMDYTTKKLLLQKGK